MRCSYGPSTNHVVAFALAGLDGGCLLRAEVDVDGAMASTAKLLLFGVGDPRWAHIVAFFSPWAATATLVLVFSDGPCPTGKCEIQSRPGHVVATPGNPFTTDGFDARSPNAMNAIVVYMTSAVLDVFNVFHLYQPPYHVSSRPLIRYTRFLRKHIQPANDDRNHGAGQCSLAPTILDGIAEYFEHCCLDDSRKDHSPVCGFRLLASTESM